MHWENERNEQQADYVLERHRTGIPLPKADRSICTCGGHVSHGAFDQWAKLEIKYVSHHKEIYTLKKQSQELDFKR